MIFNFPTLREGKALDENFIRFSFLHRKFFLGANLEILSAPRLCALRLCFQFLSIFTRINNFAVNQKLIHVKDSTRLFVTLIVHNPQPVRRHFFTTLSSIFSLSHSPYLLKIFCCTTLSITLTNLLTFVRTVLIGLSMLRLR